MITNVFQPLWFTDASLLDYHKVTDQGYHKNFRAPFLMNCFYNTFIDELLEGTSLKYFHRIKLPDRFLDAADLLSLDMDSVFQDLVGCVCDDDLERLMARHQTRMSSKHTINNSALLELGSTSFLKQVKTNPDLLKKVLLNPGQVDLIYNIAVFCEVKDAHLSKYTNVIDFSSMSKKFDKPPEESKNMSIITKRDLQKKASIYQGKWVNVTNEEVSLFIRNLSFAVDTCVSVKALIFDMINSRPEIFWLAAVISSTPVIVSKTEEKNPSNDKVFCYNHLNINVLVRLLEESENNIDILMTLFNSKMPAESSNFVHYTMANYINSATKTSFNPSVMQIALSRSYIDLYLGTSTIKSLMAESERELELRRVYSNISKTW